MCIVCNVGTRGSDFVDAYSSAQNAMKKATDVMLSCPVKDKRYDKIHKSMVRLCVEWNKIEHQREIDANEKPH